MPKPTTHDPDVLAALGQLTDTHVAQTEAEQEATRRRAEQAPVARGGNGNADGENDADVST